MGRQFNLDVASELTNPPSEFTVQAQGKTFPTESFSPNEAQLLNQQLNELVFSLDSSHLMEIVQQRQTAIARTAAFAKQVFDEKLFGGVNARDNEIGFSVLRPGHIRADPASGDAENDWFFTPGATGFVDWIGDGTSANNFTFTEDQVSVVMAFVDQDVNSEISAVNVDAFGRNVDMLPLDMNDSKHREDNENDISVQPLQTLIGEENDEVHIRLRADRDVESQPRLFGFTFGLGSFLNSEDF